MDVPPLPSLSRRRFLGLLGATGAAALVPRPASGLRLDDTLFSLGVASGDPLHDRVLLWTRLVRDVTSADPGVGTEPIEVEWEVAEDEAFRRISTRGVTTAVAAHGHSVHVDAVGLRPSATYWYRFRARGEISPVGRTRTAPAPGSSPSRYALAFASCQNRDAGWFTPFERMVAVDQDLDLVVHLGDYIYETTLVPNPVRPTRSPEPTDLRTYRWRHAEYRTDPHLLAAHAAFPFACTWDDHEVDNDWAGDHGQDGDDPAAFRARRRAAAQAYWEHMPLRVPAPHGRELWLPRTLQAGTLADLHVLDTRSFRDDHACQDGPSGGGQVARCDELFDPSRSMLGARQRDDLLRAFDATEARWTVLASSLLFSRLEQAPGNDTGHWTDGWDGYPIERDRLVQAMADGPVRNALVLSGDIHNHWTIDLRTDWTDEASTIGAEFNPSSVTSPGSDFSRYLPENPHVRYHEYRWRGYGRLTLTPDAATCDYEVVETTFAPTSPGHRLASFVVEDRAGRAVPDGSPPSPSGDGPAPDVETPTTGGGVAAAAVLAAGAASLGRR